MVTFSGTKLINSYCFKEYGVSKIERVRPFLKSATSTLEFMNSLLSQKYICMLLCMLLLQSCFLFRKSSKEHKHVTKDEKQKYEEYTAKLGIIIDEKSNISLMKACITWLGVPYKFGGTTKQGTDCSGLVNNLYKEGYQKQLPRSTKEMYDQFKKIDDNDLREGDLVFFNFESKKVSHVGLYLKENKFIHASTKKGVIVGSLDDPYNKKYFLRGGRVE